MHATPPDRAALNGMSLFRSGAPLAILFWGASFVATRVALRSFDPFALVAARFVLGAALLYAILYAQRVPLWPEPTDRVRCVLLGLILGAHLLIQGYAMLHTSAIHSGWIVGFSPVTIALGAQLFLGERLRAIGWLGVAIASSGVFLVTLGESPDFANAGVGDLLILFSCLTWTAYTLLGTRPVARSGTLRVTAFAMGIAAAIASFAVVLRPGASGLSAWTPEHPRSIAAILFLGLLCSGVAFSLWLRAVERFGAAQTGALLYFQPFVTVAVAVLAIGEPLTVHALLGGPIVLSGVALVRRGAVRPAPASAALRTRPVRPDAPAARDV